MNEIILEILNTEGLEWCYQYPISKSIHFCIKDIGVRQLELSSKYYGENREFLNAISHWKKSNKKAQDFMISIREDVKRSDITTVKYAIVSYDYLNRYLDLEDNSRYLSFSFDQEDTDLIKLIAVLSTDLPYQIFLKSYVHKNDLPSLFEKYNNLKFRYLELLTEEVKELTENIDSLTNEINGYKSRLKTLLSLTSLNDSDLLYMNMHDPETKIEEYIEVGENNDN